MDFLNKILHLAIGGGEGKDPISTILSLILSVAVDVCVE